MREIKFSYIENQVDLASMITPFGREFSPCVMKRENGDYSIRIILTKDFRGGGSWDYFEVAPDGVITKSPRGMAKIFNKLKITDIEQAVEKWKEKEINQ